MKVGFYEKDITPPLGCYLPGYYKNYNATHVLDPLFVRAAVICSDENTIAIVSIDACEFPQDMHDIVTKRIFEYTGIKSSDVLISVNHNHKGIPIEDNPEIKAYADVPYKDVVYRLIADCVTLAYRKAQIASPFYGCGYANDISFNRTFIMKDGTYQTMPYYDDGVVCPLAQTDPDVPVLFFKDADDKPVGAIVSFAVHQDCTPGDSYSGAFASVMSDELKKKYGAEFITVFLAGTSGDINHVDINAVRNGTYREDFYIYMGKRLAQEVDKAISSGTLTDNINVRSEKNLFCVPKRMCDENTMDRYMQDAIKNKDIAAFRNISFYEANYNTPQRDVYLQCLVIGDVLIYAYPGEIFVDFGLDLKKRSPSQKVLISTLANTGCGYVPTKKAFEPQSKLYEIQLCYGSCLSPEAGYIMTDELLKYASKLTGNM